jgi:short-subunit dehydrogenase
VLITGASAGIGRALAIECAKRNMNLFLVDLPDSYIDQTIFYLRKHYTVDIEYYTADLTSDEAPLNIYHYAKQLDIKINMLINNAGIGHLGSFCDYDHQFYSNMLRLNIESVVMLTRLFLPQMREIENAYILNLGSIASFYPIPFKIVYAGSKSFVYFFSRALKAELKHTSVKVSVVCPGPIVTNQEVINRIRQSGFWGKISAMRANKIAEIAISGLLKGKPLIIPGLVNKFYLRLNLLLPVSLKETFLFRKFNVRDKV